MISKNIAFSEPLLKDKSVSIHQKNCQLLAIEIFTAKSGVTPEINE